MASNAILPIRKTSIALARVLGVAAFVFSPLAHAQAATPDGIRICTADGSVYYIPFPGSEPGGEEEQDIPGQDGSGKLACHLICQSERRKAVGLP